MRIEYDITSACPDNIEREEGNIIIQGNLFRITSSFLPFIIASMSRSSAIASARSQPLATPTGGWNYYEIDVKLNGKLAQWALIALRGVSTSGQK